MPMHLSGGMTDLSRALYSCLTSPDGAYRRGDLYGLWKEYSLVYCSQFPEQKFDYRNVPHARLRDLILIVAQCATTTFWANPLEIPSVVGTSVNSLFGTGALRSIMRDLMRDADPYDYDLGKAVTLAVFKDECIGLGLRHLFYPVFHALDSDQLRASFDRPYTVFVVGPEQSAELLIHRIARFYLDVETLFAERGLGLLVHYISERMPPESIQAYERAVLVRNLPDDAKLRHKNLPADAFRLVDLRAA
jgi:hypothetical protein